MVLTIAASLGQLTAKLNAVFTPSHVRGNSSKSFDNSLSRLAESIKGSLDSNTASLATSALSSVQYKYDWVPTAVKDALGSLDSYTPGKYRSQLSGFNPDKIGPNHASSMDRKYIVARVFEQIDVQDPDALNRAVAVLKEQGWDATIVGRDKIDFNDGIGPIDVIRNMSTQKTNMAWQWLVEERAPDVSSLAKVALPAAGGGTLAPPDHFVVVQQVAAQTGYPNSGISVHDFTQKVAERLVKEDANWGRYINTNGNLGFDILAYRVNGQNQKPYKIDIVLGANTSGAKIHWLQEGIGNGTWKSVN